jgi:hypothetical protein
MAINAGWHRKNRVPKNPSLEQRIKWHIGHMKNCNCRLPSPKLMQEIKNYEAGQK